jgi:hypothetical protein
MAQTTLANFLRDPNMMWIQANLANAKGVLIVYRDEPIEDAMLKASGATALLIDWIGASGGVGPSIEQSFRTLSSSNVTAKP